MTAAISPPISQGILLRDVSWDLYERMLAETEGQHLRITFDEGRMELMSPTPRHEQIKKLLGSLVEALAVRRNIPIRPAGSTTFKSRRLKVGLEPDESYYIQHEKQVRGKSLDLKKSPPPDLVIEVYITYRDIDREQLYARMGVPEIWRHDGERLMALELSGRRYQEVTHSRAFPVLPVGELDRFLRMASAVGFTAMQRRFQQWVAELESPEQRE